MNLKVTSAYSVIKNTDDNLDLARAAKSKAKEIFSGYGNVVGVGITQINGTPGIMVAMENTNADTANFPDNVDGVPVVVRVTGEIHKQIG